MQKDSCFISFNTEVDPSLIPNQFNNPFDLDTPPICRLAAKELQTFIVENEQEWHHNFGLDSLKKQVAKGKMFGVLVVETSDGKLGYLSTFSGKLAGRQHHSCFVPSLFDISTDDYFMDKGMSELTAIGTQIKEAKSHSEIKSLKEKRKAKSIKIQQQLFDNYHFVNRAGKSKSLCAIFDDSLRKMPPSGAGECAAPKLLQHAFKHNMRPLAIAEFWWGDPSKSGDRQHQEFYPACMEKCHPILTYMLKENTL